MSPREEQQQARTEDQLIALGRRRGYANPQWWARRVLEGRRKKAAQPKRAFR